MGGICERSIGYQNFEYSETEKSKCQMCFSTISLRFFNNHGPSYPMEQSQMYENHGYLYYTLIR